MDLQHPPTPAQLRAMEDYHKTTSSEKFVVEIYDGTDLIALVSSLDELRTMLHEAAAEKRGEELAAAFRGSRSVRFGSNGSSIGGRIGEKVQS